MSAALDQLCERYGVGVAYTGLDGVSHSVPEATKIAILGAMGVGARNDAEIEESLKNAPGSQDPALFEENGARCFRPGWLEAGRSWGIALQLYALRSKRNWGIGDFADLVAFADIAATLGADFLGLNPLHAMFIAAPERTSPFSPSSRRFLNPLYIAIDAIPGFTPQLVDEKELETLRATEFVDYGKVSALKLTALAELWPTWRGLSSVEGTYAHEAFAAFSAAQGDPLARHALFEALSLAMVAQGHASGWRDWPAAFHDIEGPAVADFASAHRDEIAFQMWLQWLANVQLGEVQAVLSAKGMRIGLYLDMAVGEAPDGSTCWTDPELTMADVHIGAPPDYFSLTGQDWNLAPLAPNVLVKRNLAPYADVLGTTMSSAGALRIDHAMAVRQLFLVPEGGSPAEGAYVHYPMGAMISALAHLSHTHETIIIGEDLGNLPWGFREVMARAGMLSYRILYFERYDHGFIAAHDYPRESIACLSTHDLPTFEGWWRGADIALRQAHDLIDAQGAAGQAAQRQSEREQLAERLIEHGLISETTRVAGLAAANDAKTPLPADLVVGVHRYLASTPSRMMAVRLEDMCGQRDPVNLPGTVGSYPNWSRKLAPQIESLAGAPLFNALGAALAAARPRQP